MCLLIMPPAARCLWIGICGLCWCAIPAAGQTPPSVLHLTDEGFVAGELRRSDSANVLRWQSPLFAHPIEFPLNAIKAVHYTVSGPQPQPDGDYGFELADDDALYGKLLGMTEEAVEVESARLGRVRLKREHVRRMYRWKGRDSIYLGPNGLAGWKTTTPDWREEGGQLFADRPGTSIFGDLGIAEKAMIEVELSWKKKPDFLLALGVSEADASAQEAFHLEVWDDDLVAIGESARDADVASVQPIGAGEGHVRIQAYLDQKQRRLILLSRSGKLLATLQVSAKKQPQIVPGVRLTNKKGDVRLESLRVTRWNGQPPREVREDQSRLHRTDGSIVYGRVTAFDPKTKEFTLDDGEEETIVHQDAIADIFLAPRQLAAKAPAAAAPRTRLRVVYRDGSRYTGTVTRIEDGHLRLSCPSVSPTHGSPAAEPLRLPLAGLRSLVVLPHGKESVTASLGGRAGRLEMDGIRLKGWLRGGTEQPQESCLVWQPELSQSASALRPSRAGRIVYREPPPALPAPAAYQAPQQRGLFAEVVDRLRSGKPAQPAPVTGRRTLHLRSGDTIPCEVRRITEKGIEIKTPLSDATFVANEKIKSVDLVAAGEAPHLDEVKRDRLLTLPRLQKDSPPTHLVCSRNGDFLRGRILEMDDKVLKIEVRLETRELPRERIAQIIWFHADELAGEKAAAAPVDAAKATRVQAMRADGIRLTFMAQKADVLSISGTSEVLGACHAELAEVDQLLFGTYIEQSAAQLAHHRWKLHPAAEPKFAQSDGNASADGAPTGAESPLVGQPAFAFKLDMLNGPQFQLAQHKGKVVILEFWATWCGPCLQSMPMIDRVAQEFAQGGVELVAVNMEEQPEQVKAMLERHKLKMLVALDRDGVVAARYAVTAIPQTVVIDRDGKIARLFVGGGKKTAEALRKALQELTAGKP